MKRYIADLHFDHKNLTSSMDNRMFATVDEMNEYMISQWNSAVKKNDEVHIIGDLSFGNGERTNGFVERLNGRLFLIEGNHDHMFLGDRKFNSRRLSWIKPYHEMKDNKRKVIMCHYPVFCYNGQYRRDENGKPITYMLYGHVHNTKDQELVDDFVMQTRRTSTISARGTEPELIPCNMINCFCMYSDYIPLTLDEWIEVNERRMRKRYPDFKNY